MIYKSPIEKLMPLGSYRKSMEYNGNMREVIEIIKKRPNPVDQVFFPQRLVRGIIDYKIENPDADQISLRELVQESMNLCLKIYSEEDYQKSLEKLEEKLTPEILTKEIHERIDDVTLKASLPALSSQTAQALSPMSSMLMIPIAHGSLMAATDIFLRYRESNSQNDSAIYPVRFSADKLKDQLPMLSEEEVRYLMEIGRGKEIVIFDEDVYTGRTMNETIKFFENLFRKQVIPTTNNSRHYDYHGLIPRKDLDALAKRYP